MASTMVLNTYERIDRVSETCMPNIWSVFMPALIEELQKHDPDFDASPGVDEIDRCFVEAEDSIPIDGMGDANLVFTIAAVDNLKLRANKVTIERAVTSMLESVLHPMQDIYVLLFTG